ncbi:hypothetical protein [Nostoc punctiforme]|nr:hypothetical protein [Nostoc punctiforme]
MTDQLIEQVCHEITTGEIKLFMSHALMETTCLKTLRRRSPS